ncbi:MAG: hypothetical protein EBU90_26280 [Proteobacteria bacterium]|nr:hypothetical protein [Pseudomonadota bacterium]
MHERESVPEVGESGVEVIGAAHVDHEEVTRGAARVTDALEEPHAANERDAGGDRDSVGVGHVEGPRAAPLGPSKA